MISKRFIYLITCFFYFIIFTSCSGDNVDDFNFTLADSYVSHKLPIEKSTLILSEYNTRDLTYLSVNNNQLYFNLKSNGVDKLLQYDLQTKKSKSLSDSPGSFMLNDWIVCYPSLDIGNYDYSKSNIQFINSQSLESVSLSTTDFEKSSDLEWQYVLDEAFGYFDGNNFYFIYNYIREGNAQKIIIMSYSIKDKKVETISQLDLIRAYANNEYIYWCDNSEGKHLIELYSIKDKTIKKIDISNDITGIRFVPIISDPIISGNKIYFYTSEYSSMNNKLYSVDLKNNEVNLVIDFGNNVVSISKNKWFLMAGDNVTQSGFIYDDKNVMYSKQFRVLGFVPGAGAVGFNNQNYGNSKGFLFYDISTLNGIISS